MGNNHNVMQTYLIIIRILWIWKIHLPWMNLATYFPYESFFNTLSLLTHLHEFFSKKFWKFIDFVFKFKPIGEKRAQEIYL